ncbi:MAG: hypothetical protein M3Q98_04110 [Actinomycetota bacterium]|nr:hypothetical protein [Actinomycetota bacterium]
MKIVRASLMVIGLAMGLWGLWLMRDFRFDQLLSAVIWLAGGVVAHDGILAPFVVGAGVVLARVTPAYARKPVTVGLILWGTVTLAVANVLSGQGGKPDNDTVLDRPYLMTWLILTIIVFLGIAAYAGLMRSRSKPGTSMQTEA